MRAPSVVRMDIPEDAPATGQAHAVARCADALLGALDGVATTPAWSMTAAEQREALVALTAAQARLTELRLRVLAAAEKNDVGADTAASSAAAWLAHRTKETRARTGSDLRLAEHLDSAFETTRAALARGRLNEEQARVIVRAVLDLPDRVPAHDRGRAEAHLVAQAEHFDAKALRILGRRLFEVIDPDAADEQEGKKLEDEEREARRAARFSLRDNGDGSCTGSFKLPALHARMLQKALHALTSPRRIGPEGRVDAEGQKIPHATLLGHGFMELIEHLPTETLPRCGGLSATIVVTIDYARLVSGLGAAGLDTGGRISAAEARRLACDAGIIPLVLGGDSMPLDVGRERRFHTRYQRIALAQRDGGCSAEGCDRPPGWTEAHHETPWSGGGATNVEQGRLLCSWHHHVAHDPGYTAQRRPDGRLRFHRRT